MAGLAHARSQGRVGGCPTVMTPERLQAALLLHKQGKNKTQIGKAMGVSRVAVARGTGTSELTRAKRKDPDPAGDPWDPAAYGIEDVSREGYSGA